MTEIALDTLIAERTLLTDAGEHVVLSVCAPQQIGEEKWACQYRITGIGEPLTGNAYGIDALQALQLVSLALREELEKAGCILTFLDNANWQSYFPEQVRDYGQPDLRVRIEDLMVNEQSNWMEERGMQASRLPERDKIENTEQKDG